MKQANGMTTSASSGSVDAAGHLVQRTGGGSGGHPLMKPSWYRFGTIMMLLRAERGPIPLSDAWKHNAERRRASQMVRYGHLEYSLGCFHLTKHGKKVLRHLRVKRKIWSRHCAGPFRPRIHKKVEL